MGVWYRSNLLLFLQVVDRIITELCVFDVDKVHFFGIFSISHPIFAYPPRLLTLFLPPSFSLSADQRRADPRRDFPWCDSRGSSGQNGGGFPTG